MTSPPEAFGILARQIESILQIGLHEGERRRVCQAVVSVGNLQPLNWLKNQNCEFRIYWSGRDGGFETAGAGVADLIYGDEFKDFKTALEHIRRNLEDAEKAVRYFGGRRFDEAVDTDPDWRVFGRFLFVLPRFELLRTASKTVLRCNLLVPDDIHNRAAILDELKTLVPADTDSVPKPLSRVKRLDTPDSKEWSKLIKTALTEIGSNRYRKIVLGRKTTLTFDDNLDALEILAAQESELTDCYRFYIQPCRGRAFWGASPEQLYSRKERSLHTEAVAGTRPRGGTSAEDDRLGDELLSSDKDRREHQLVMDSIRESLGAITRTESGSPPAPVSLLKLARLQHLRAQFSYCLNDGVSDAEILDALHPTAAVGGSPRGAVLAELRRLEPYDRGWYAGPIGWLGRDGAEFAVAIRSALVTGKTVNLYAGAGIVAGSQAESEWREIENKMSGFLDRLR